MPTNPRPGSDATAHRPDQTHGTGQTRDDALLAAVADAIAVDGLDADLLAALTWAWRGIDTELAEFAGGTSPSDGPRCLGARGTGQRRRSGRAGFTR